MVVGNAGEERAGHGPPPPVRHAVRLMWLSLLLGVVAAVVLGADDVSAAYSSGDDGGAELDALDRVLVLLGIGAGLVGAALWGLLASRVRRGENWARVVTWAVAAGVAVAALLFWTTPTAWGFAVPGVVLLLAACVLLARPASNRYFLRS